MKLQLEGLHMHYSAQPLFENFDLHLEQREFVSIVGPSGCGKSTLLSLVSGVLPLQSGQILVDGASVVGVSSHFSLMPQDDLLLPWMTLLENVCLYASIHGGKAALREQALESLPLFGLSGYEKHYPAALSGGMRQRAAFLRTALTPADILLLDEPFASLDVITREEMQDWLLAMREQLGRTILLVTHDIDEAIYLSDRVLVLGGQPAQIQHSFSIVEQNRNRSWLLSQTALHEELYNSLKEVAPRAL